MTIGGSSQNVQNQVFGGPNNAKQLEPCPHLGQIAIHPGLFEQSEDVN